MKSQYGKIVQSFLYEAVIYFQSNTVRRNVLYFVFQNGNFVLGCISLIEEKVLIAVNPCLQKIEWSCGEVFCVGFVVRRNPFYFISRFFCSRKGVLRTSNALLGFVAGKVNDWIKLCSIIQTRFFEEKCLGKLTSCWFLDSSFLRDGLIITLLSERLFYLR